MKWNPDQIADLSKGKMTQKVGYHKGTFITDTDVLADIVKNGGQVEFKAREIRDIKGIVVQVIECRIYFIDK